MCICWCNSISSKSNYPWNVMLILLGAMFLRLCWVNTNTNLYSSRHYCGISLRTELKWTVVITRFVTEDSHMDLKCWNSHRGYFVVIVLFRQASCCVFQANLKFIVFPNARFTNVCFYIYICCLVWAFTGVWGVRWYCFGLLNLKQNQKKKHI